MLIENIPYRDPFSLCKIFSNQVGTTFIDSSKFDDNLGRYSFLAVDPFQILTSKNKEVKIDGKLVSYSTNPFEVLEKELAKYPLKTFAGLPPFQSGVAGFFSYDLKNHLEELPQIEEDDLQFPDLFLGFYDIVIAFDNLYKECYVISSGYPEKISSLRLARSGQRLTWILDKIDNLESNFNKPTSDTTIPKKSIDSNFTKDEYLKAVQKTIDYIHDGDIFEANISQRFISLLPKALKPIDLYEKIRQKNPAPFSAFINANKTQILSSSPERFLKLNNKHVETRPIKGTAPRSKDTAIDKQNAEDLSKSEKDWAENVMIVDLMRNDISKVCEDGSVKVPQLCKVESFETVHHLVSSVEGKLQQNKNAVDLLRATFPGGSITGAPKIRAMEIIAEIEGIKRGPYCGSIGYIGFNGDMDTSIVIRTYAIKNNIVTYQAGGAIVSDSSPAGEYQETLDKAKALKSALTGEK